MWLWSRRKIVAARLKEKAASGPSGNTDFRPAEKPMLKAKRGSEDASGAPSGEAQYKPRKVTRGAQVAPCKPKGSPRALIAQGCFVGYGRESGLQATIHMSLAIVGNLNEVLYYVLFVVACLFFQDLFVLGGYVLDSCDLYHVDMFWIVRVKLRPLRVYETSKFIMVSIHQSCRW